MSVVPCHIWLQPQFTYPSEETTKKKVGNERIVRTLSDQQQPGSTQDAAIAMARSAQSSATLLQTAKNSVGDARKTVKPANLDWATGVNEGHAHQP